MDSMTQVTTEDQDLLAISEPDFDFDAIDLDPDDGPHVRVRSSRSALNSTCRTGRDSSLRNPTKEFDRKDVDKHLERLLEGHRGRRSSRRAPPKRTTLSWLR